MTSYYHLYFLLVAVLLYYWILHCRREYGSIDQNLIDSYEKKLMYHLYGNIAESSWITLNVSNHTKPQHVHIMQSANFSDHAPDIVLIHGYGATSALAWRNTFVSLSQLNYDILAIDLPGFGRSEGDGVLLTASTEEAFDLYCEYFDEIFKLKNLHNPYVVAHSIGGYIFVRCASRNPKLSSRLLLSNVPGLFSSNGEYDYAWATFFTLGVPHNILRLCGAIENSRYMMDLVLSVLNIDIHALVLQYWHLVQLNERMQSDILIRKFIRHRFIYALGVGAGLPHLLNLTMPVALLYGEHDFIAPPHQGHFISNLTGIKVYVLDNSSHVPYSMNEGRDFLQIIDKVREEAISPSLHKHNAYLSTCLLTNISKWAWYPCLPIPPIISNLLYKHGIYRAIDSIYRDCV